VARLKRRRDPAVVVSCEHASNRLPSRYGSLGLTAKALQSHVAWDIGAREVAVDFARHLRCELYQGRWSRLLVDLNRSADHGNLIAESSFGVVVPGNRDVDPEERERRLRTYWLPYRTAVEAALRAGIGRSGRCVHLSVHSFTPVVDGRPRNADVGILYDPQRRPERELAQRWARVIAAGGVRVRLNYPYRGTADGLTKALRRRFPGSAYVGLELELNQRLFADRASCTHIRRVTRESFLAIVRGNVHPVR
jgi:predicted N-formylglutamate amidohydrolase